jgi:type IV pilus assembly protein PilZ
MADEADQDAGDGGRDRRDSDRHPIELKVEYKRLNKFFADYTKNICKGGTFIKTSRPLDVGTRFVFKLYVPKLDQPVKLQGEVKWVVKPEDAEAGEEPRDPGMGIRFIYRDDRERYELEELVEKLMVDSLGQRLSSKLMGHSGGRGDGT